MLSPQFLGSEEEGIFRGGVEWDLMPHIMDLAIWLLDVVDDKEIVELSSKKNSLGNIEITFILGNIRVILYADWSTDDVRKPEVSGEIKFSNGKLLKFDEDQMIDSNEENFHRRNEKPVWFDVAEPDYSNQILSFFDLLDGKSSFNSTLESSCLVDLLIENALAEMKS